MPDQLNPRCTGDVMRDVCMYNWAIARLQMAWPLCSIKLFIPLTCNARAHIVPSPCIAITFYNSPCVGYSGGRRFNYRNVIFKRDAGLFCSFIRPVVSSIVSVERFGYVTRAFTIHDTRRLIRTFVEIRARAIPTRI